MNSISIQVTQEDIDLGSQGNTADCAIARAMKRQLGTQDLCVSSLSFMLHGKRYKTSDALATFVHSFDISKTLVFPAEFLLDLSTPIKHVDYATDLVTDLVHV
jgi:hypothetical protein